MFETVALPAWVLVLIGIAAAISIGERLLFPSVRWFLRKRAERVVAKVNERLTRPIQPFKLARRADMIQRLTYDRDVLAAVSEYASEEGMPDEVALEMARRYAREIVPSFSATAYFGVGIRVARWLGNTLYHVRLGHVERAEIDQDATVVFIMNHRSNMDYMLVTYLAADASALSYAVGEWARVWPLSRLIRSMGAYFIRRRSRNALYRRVLARYVQMATENGVTQAVFPEGGLSLDGKVAAPKLGLLNYIIEGWTPESRDVVFVPVALNYDRILEDRILISAGQRGDRKFNARMSVVGGFILKHVWLRICRRAYKFGVASVSFGKPLSLREFATHHAELPRTLGRELMTRIENVMPILPIPVLSTVLLEAADGATRADLELAVTKYFAGLDDDTAHNVSCGDAASIVAEGLKVMAARRLIRQTGSIVRVKDDQRHILEYYANSIVRVRRKNIENAAPAGL
jgi:glycerol-3-phosphate O-acyltransferase